MYLQGYPIMLKKFLAALYLSTISFFATAQTYVFTGIVDSVSGPDVPFSAGDSYNVIVEVDLSSPGYLTLVGDNSPNHLGPDYYEAQYISGDAVPKVNWDGWVEYYYWDNTGGNNGQVCVLNTLCITSAGGTGGIQSWNAGTSITFSQSWSYLDGSTQVQNHISGTITNVETLPSVNVPLIPLWGVGILSVLLVLTTIIRKRELFS